MFVCVSVCVCCLCVCVVGVCEAAGGEGVPEEPGIQNQKQEPHTKMWGITFMSAGSGKSKIFNGSSDWNLQKPRAECQASLAPSLEMGSAQFDFDGMYSQKSMASNANLGAV